MTKRNSEKQMNAPSVVPATKREFPPILAVLAVLVILTLAVYWRLFDPGAVMEAGDSQPLAAHCMKRMLKTGVVSGWSAMQGFGSGGVSVLGDWNVLFYLFLPDQKTAEALMAVTVLLAGLFFYLFLRERGYQVRPALVGAVAYGFSTSLVSLSNAGHIGKFFALCYMAAALWLVQRAFARRSWIAAAFAGLFAGLALSWQLDVAILLGLAAGTVWLYDLISVFHLDQAQLSPLRPRPSSSSSISSAFPRTKDEDETDTASSVQGDTAPNGPLASAATAPATHPSNASALSPSAIRHQPSAISHLPSAIRHPPSPFRHQPSAIRHQPSAILRRLGQLSLVGLIALTVAWPMISGLFASNIKAVGSIANDPQKNWLWSTAWSLPPAETFRLACARYYGWYSGHSTAPYWGEIGQSDGWEQTKQGFRNFDQTTEYVGIGVLVLALAGLLSWRPRRRSAGESGSETPLTPALRRPAIASGDGGSPKGRGSRLTSPLGGEVGPAQAGSGEGCLSSLQPPSDALLWFAIAAVSLLLAYGRFFPLYRLFFSLPFFSSMRCPVKFVHVVALAVAVLAAQGAARLEQALRAPPGERRRLVGPLAMASGVLALLFVGALLLQPWASPSFTSLMISDGYGEQLPAIQQNMWKGLAASLVVCVALLGLSLAPLTKVYERFGPRAGKWVGGLLIALVAADLALAGRHYVSYSGPDRYFQSNVVIDYLRGFPSYRVKFLPHNWGIFNYWNSLITPLYMIRSADVPAMSRPPADIEAFYRALESHPQRLWQLSGVRHLVLPRKLQQQVRQILGDQARELHGFNLVSGGDIGAYPQWAAGQGNGQFVIMEYPAGLSCPTWYGTAEWTDFDGMLKRLQDPGLDVGTTLLLDASARRPADAGRPGGPADGTARLVEFTDNRIIMESKAGRDGWLLVNDYYDIRWTATVDGQTAPVIRADGLFRAVPVPAGSHRVEMAYHGNANTFWFPLTGGGVLVTLGALALVHKAWRRRRGM